MEYGGRQYMISNESFKKTYETIWQNTLVLVENAVSRTIYDKWIRPAKMIFCNETTEKANE